MSTIVDLLAAAAQMLATLEMAAGSSTWALAELSSALEECLQVVVGVVIELARSASGIHSTDDEAISAKMSQIQNVSRLIELRI